MEDWVVEVMEEVEKAVGVKEEVSVLVLLLER